MLLSINPKNHLRFTTTPWAKWMLLASLLCGFAYTAKAVASGQIDRTISQDDAQKMLLAVKNADGLPLAVNDLVLKELNAYLDTPVKRQAIKEALERMKAHYQGHVDAMLTQYQLPQALEAVPLVESGYQNLSDTSPEETRPAGLWQFMAPTARRMGVAVHEGKDERLNVDKLNDAAGRLIKGNALFYNDLGLSLLAFNWGEKTVNHYLGLTRSRNPWVLVKAKGNDSYLAKVIAAAIVIANPEALD